MSAQSSLPPFHLAFPVTDLEATRKFYVEVLGCEQGREDEGNWIDFNFFGHQIVAHLVDVDEHQSVKSVSKVDGHGVPIPHFGAVLDWEAFDVLVENLKKHKIKFEIEPYLRFEGKPGEQRTCFIFDPSKNALEFKTFKNKESLFAT